MEQFSQLGAKPRGGGFIYASSSVATASTTTTTTTTPTTAVAAPPVTASISIYCGPNPDAYTLPRLHPPKPEASSSSHHYPFARPTDVDAMKARILSHPHYSNLLKAYMDCQKVGAPPEVADRLSAVAREFEARQRAGVGCREQPADPELDQFMEAFYHMLVKYREELTRPLQEAMDFLRRVESQLNSLTNGSFRILSSASAVTPLGKEGEVVVVVLGFGTLGLQQCNAGAYGRVAVSTPTTLHINEERIFTGGFFP